MNRLGDVYVEGPKGLIRVPSHVDDPLRSEVVFAVPRCDEVELFFVREECGSLPDHAVGEVVAHLVMPRDRYEELVAWLPDGLDVWRRHGV